MFHDKVNTNIHVNTPGLEHLLPTFFGSFSRQFFNDMYLSFISYVWVFCLHGCMCIICMKWQKQWGQATGLPGTGVTGGCKQTCGYWKWNQTLQEQPVRLTAEHAISCCSDLYHHKSPYLVLNIHELCMTVWPLFPVPFAQTIILRFVLQ